MVGTTDTRIVVVGVTPNACDDCVAGDGETTITLVDRGTLGELDADEELKKLEIEVEEVDVDVLLCVVLLVCTVTTAVLLISPALVLFNSPPLARLAAVFELGSLVIPADTPTTDVDGLGVKGVTVVGYWLLVLVIG